MDTNKPRVNNQGKAVIEAHRGEFLVMTPDGEINIALSLAEADAMVAKWAEKHADQNAINVLSKEIRT